MPRKKKEEVVVAPVSKATIHDFEVIVEPLITEKSMTVNQENGQYIFKVKKNANKVEIRNAIERIYNVTVTGVQTVNVPAKNTTRGTRFHGTISGFKKAIVTLKEGDVINLYAE